MCVEVIRPDRFAEHRVVIQVDELLGQSGNPVEMTLDRRRAERREVTLVKENILKSKSIHKIDDTTI